MLRMLQSIDGIRPFYPPFLGEHSQLERTSVLPIDHVLFDLDKEATSHSHPAGVVRLADPVGREGLSPPLLRPSRVAEVEKLTSETLDAWHVVRPSSSCMTCHNRSNPCRVTHVAASSMHAFAATGRVRDWYEQPGSSEALSSHRSRGTPCPFRRPVAVAQEADTDIARTALLLRTGRS